MNFALNYTAPLVGIAMGSESDYEVMSGAIDILRQFDVAHEVRVLSAHRTPRAMLEYAEAARGRGLRVLIAGAGGAAHLPGMIAAATALPVVGVPVPGKQLQGLDALLSIVQMPAGVPVATVAVGNARNAGLLAVQMLATSDPALYDRLDAYKRDLVRQVEAMDGRVREAAAAHE